MARRYINTSQYNPYSFQEMWQPALAATQAHQQQAQIMMNLEMQNAYIGAHINPDLDPEEYARYKSYEQRMQQASQDLLTRGLSSNSFNNIYGMSVDYARNIKPIEEAVANKQKYLTTLNTTLTEHPEFGVIGTLEKPLRDFRMGVPRAELANGNQIQQDVATLASAYGKSLNQLSTEEYTQLRDIVWNQTGLNWDEVQQQISTSGSPLDTIIKLTLQKHGVVDNNGQSRMNSPQDYAKMLQYANTGAYGAMGGRTPQVVQNDVQALHTMRNQDAQLAIQSAKAAITRAATIQNMRQSELQNDFTLVQSGLMSQDDFANKWGNGVINNQTNQGDPNKPLYPELGAYAGLNQEYRDVVIGNKTYSGSNLRQDMDVINKYTNNGQSFGSHTGLWSLFSPFTQKYLMKQLQIKDVHHLTAADTKKLYHALFNYTQANKIPALATYSPESNGYGYKSGAYQTAYNILAEAHHNNAILPKELNQKVSFNLKPSDIKTMSLRTNPNNVKYVDIFINNAKTPITVDPDAFIDRFSDFDRGLYARAKEIESSVNNYIKYGNLGVYDPTVINDHNAYVQHRLALMENILFTEPLYNKKK